MDSIDFAIPALQGIILLVVLGFILIGAEVFIPGMILGILGGICLLAAIAWSYTEYGLLTGSMVFGGVSFLGLIGFFIWLSTFPRTFIGRQIINNDVLSTDDNAERKALLGQNGVSLSILRPAGVAKIEGHRTDVVAESGFIPAGCEITVVTIEGNRIVVRKKT